MSSLQERLENLQVTMLDVMIKYGNLKKLEVNIFNISTIMMILVLVNVMVIYGDNAYANVRETMIKQCMAI